MGAENASGCMPEGGVVWAMRGPQCEGQVCPAVGQRYFVAKAGIPGDKRLMGVVARRVIGVWGGLFGFGTRASDQEGNGR